MKYTKISLFFYFLLTFFVSQYFSLTFASNSSTVKKKQTVTSTHHKSQHSSKTHKSHHSRKSHHHSSKTHKSHHSRKSHHHSSKTHKSHHSRKSHHHSSKTHKSHHSRKSHHHSSRTHKSHHSRKSHHHSSKTHKSHHSRKSHSYSTETYKQTSPKSYEYDYSYRYHESGSLSKNRDSRNRDLRNRDSKNRDLRNPNSKPSCQCHHRECSCRTKDSNPSCHHHKEHSSKKEDFEKSCHHHHHKEHSCRDKRRHFSFDESPLFPHPISPPPSRYDYDYDDHKKEGKDDYHSPHLRKKKACSEDKKSKKDKDPKKEIWSGQIFSKPNAYSLELWLNEARYVFFDKVRKFRFYLTHLSPFWSYSFKGEQSFFTANAFSSYSLGTFELGTGNPHPLFKSLQSVLEGDFTKNRFFPIVYPLEKGATRHYKIWQFNHFSTLRKSKAKLKKPSFKENSLESFILKEQEKLTSVLNKKSDPVFYRMKENLFFSNQKEA